MSKYCKNCGVESADDLKFCDNCGTEFTVAGKFSALGEFQQVPQQAQPMVMTSIVYEGGNIMNASVDMLKDTARVSPGLLQDPRAPNPLILVIILALVEALIPVITAMKVKTVVFSSDIDDGDKSVLMESITQPNITNSITIFITLLIFWYFGALLLSLFLKSGFAPEEPIRYDTFKAMRRLNAYTYLPRIAVGIIQLVLLAIHPDISVSYTTSSVDLFGVVTTVPVPSYNYSTFYLIAVIILGLLGKIYSIYILHQGVKGNNYNGAMLLFIIVILVLLGVIPNIFAFFNMF